MKRGRRWIPWGIGIAIIVSIWCLERGSRLLLTSYLRVDAVEVNGCHRTNTQQILEAASISSRAPIVELDLKEISRRVEALPWVRSCEVRRVLPDTVSLSIEEREPVALINLGRLYYVDADGTPFKELSTSDTIDYPILTGWEGKIWEMDTGGELIHEAVRFLREVQNYPYLSQEGISEIHRNECDDLIIFTAKRRTRITLCRGDLGLTIRRLEEVWKGIVKRSLPVKYILCECPDRIVIGLDERG